MRLASLAAALVVASAGLQSLKGQPSTSGRGRRARTPACVVPSDSALPVLERATRCAERYVARQGYTTDSTAVIAASPLRAEIIDVGVPPAEILRRRYGTLDGRAYGACPAGGDLRSGYVVVFRSRKQPDRLKPVIVPEDFRAPWASHRDVPLTFVDSGCVRRTGPGS